MKNKKNKYLNTKTHNGYIYFGCIGGFYFYVKADSDLKDLNLGQVIKNTQIPKYFCTDKLGHSTGTGQAFEDIFYNFFKGKGVDISKVEEMKDGVDFYLSGKPCQLKYGRSAYTVFKNLFDDKTGAYKYTGQIIITNKENEIELRKLISQNLHRFDGEKVIVNPIGTPKISKKEVNEQLHRGLASMKIDAKDLITSSNAQRNIATGIFVSFCTIIGIGTIYEYNNSYENSNNTKSQRIKIAAKISFKKHWKKGAIVSTIFAGVIFCGHLVHRQLLRPK